MSGVPLVIAAGGAPVIPTFSSPHNSCVTSTTALFCWSWVKHNWSSQLQPGLLQHIELTVIAVAIGLVIALAAAVVAYYHGWFERGFLGVFSVLYTIPTIAFFELIAPDTGLGMLTVELGLVGYTLLVLFRNTITGLWSVAPGILASARGMGMTDRQILFRVNFPIALPSIMAGIRVATVTTIGLATIAAYVAPLGLGQMIFDGIYNTFKTELIAAGGLAIVLALVADVLLVFLQRALAPWARPRMR
ncbi:MAG: ABC transporter permease [Solirubrobacteraceae bacterium]